MIKDLNTHKQYDNNTFSFIVENNKRNKMTIFELASTIDENTYMYNFNFINMVNLLLTKKISSVYFQEFLTNVGNIIMWSDLKENIKINIIDYMGRLAILLNKRLGI